MLRHNASSIRCLHISVGSTRCNFALNPEIQLLAGLRFPAAGKLPGGGRGQQRTEQGGGGVIERDSHETRRPGP